jgi:hypothetical protein
VTLLEGEVVAADDGTLALRIAAVHGAPGDHADGDLVSLEDLWVPPEPGTSILLYVDDDDSRQYRVVQDDGTLDCPAVEETTVAEAVELALDEDCLDKASERVTSWECNDTLACAVGRRPVTMPLLLLALFGLMRRRRS